MVQIHELEIVIRRLREEKEAVIEAHVADKDRTHEVRLAPLHAHPPSSALGLCQERIVYAWGHMCVRIGVHQCVLLCMC